MTAYLYDSNPMTGTMTETVYNVPDSPYTPDFIIGLDTNPYSSYVDISPTEWQYMLCTYENGNEATQWALENSNTWDALTEQWLYTR